MKYYIIKPRNRTVDSEIIEGLKIIDGRYQLADSLDDCDIAILQEGWTRSKYCIAEWKEQVNTRRKPCKEAHLFTDKYKVRLN